MNTPTLSGNLANTQELYPEQILNMLLQAAFHYEDNSTWHYCD